MKKNELILSVRDLNIKFNLRGKILHAIRGIDLDVYHGEVLAIVGESGSGKSVFTKSFMGLLDSNGSITSGTIDYFGADDHQPIRLSELKKEKDWLKVRGHEIAMIMQDPMTSLNPLKTIGDQILEAVTLHQGLNRQIRRMCSAVGLQVVRLRRSAEGPVKLGMLQPGEYRELKKSEINALRNAAMKSSNKGESHPSGTARRPGPIRKRTNSD